MTDNKVLLIIRDGYGHRDDQADNAVVLADTPHTDALMQRYPTCSLRTDGEHVGLPAGYMGGSEVGHLTIGSGRIVWQSLERINQSISNGEFFDKKAFQEVLDRVQETGGDVHLAGLLQNKGVHAHQDHLFACLELCQRAGIASEKVHVHIFSDGRDSPPRSLKQYLSELQDAFEKYEVGHVSSLIGRFYAMDRDTRWKRTQQAYDLLTQGVGTHHQSVQEAVKSAYEDDEDDEFITARVIGEYQGMADGDALIVYNYRTDRVRQLCKALLESDFDEFERETTPQIHAAVMTSYYDDIKAQVAFDTPIPDQILGQVIADNDLLQLRISETEKYPHVTFFFNGQRQKPFAHEKRVLIPSPREVKTYDQKPSMSIYEIKDQLIEHIRSEQFTLIVVNYVNGDMVGHTGDLDAAIEAVEAVDDCVHQTLEVALEHGYDSLVFADHGNCEEMAGEHQTSHTLNAIDCILVSDKKHLQADSCSLVDGGLKDIAPTALALLGIPAPKQMSGINLLD